VVTLLLIFSVFFLSMYFFLSKWFYRKERIDKIISKEKDRSL
jgi:hypothetical protein